MSEIAKPPLNVRDEEDPFLIPTGQRGSLVDHLATAQGWLPSLEPGEAVQFELSILVVLREAKND